MTATRLPESVILSQYCHGQEKNQVTVPIADAQRELADRNATAATGWRWGLAESNFIDDDGAGMTLDDENAIRRACGVAEY